MIITEFDFQQALVFLFLLITQSTENPVESSVYGLRTFGFDFNIFALQ